MSGARPAASAAQRTRSGVGPSVHPEADVLGDGRREEERVLRRVAAQPP